MNPLRVLAAALAAMALATGAPAGCQSPTGFANPENIPPFPAHAIGVPSRAPDFDAWPGFQSPPSGYGEVAFFWWQGDPLTKERLTWQLDQLTGKGITGLQINYAHTDKGGVSYGLSMRSDPPIFSPPWWDLVQWFAAEAQKRGLSISLSDYTLGLGQGKAMDEAAAAVPGLVGSELRLETKAVAGGEALDWAPPAGWISLTALREGEVGRVSEPMVDLRDHVRDGRLLWRVPEGRWSVIAVFPQKVNPSLDPTHPDSGRAYIEHFFAPFERHLPGQGGKALNFFFSDELEFRLPGLIWSERLADAFRARKGYDLRSLLAGLFVDIGPHTPKIRMDYNDVRVALSEENFFRPVFEWHQKRGMIYGCDHGGRGLDVTEFGDYFRTQRWNQGPGCDQPTLDKNLIKAKVASSIAHLYDRPRVWLEGYHSSGWGTTSAAIADATFADFLMGHNLLSFHGLYYSTHGGWWEWAPPDNHWRMPYWGHLDGFMTAIRRLSFLFSQGRHVCDVAIMYPVAPAEAGIDGARAVETAFAIGRKLYGEGIDFDFIDFESLKRARIDRRALSVSGERYRVLLLPAMRAIRFAALRKAAEFAAAGGTVIAVGSLPEASERAGRDDPVLNKIVLKTFGLEAGPAAALKSPFVRLGETGGLTAVAPGPEDAVGVIQKTNAPDLAFETGGKTPVYFLHRRIGPRDVYGLYGLPQGASVRFRASGRVERWDPWTGRASPLAVQEQADGHTRLRLPLSAEEVQLIVFSPGRAEIEKAVAAAESEIIEIGGPWTSELRPTLDNRWGDFRWPPSPGFIGAEVRRFRYAFEDRPGAGPTAPAADSPFWRPQTASFGQRFWRLGPVPDGVDTGELEKRLLEQGRPNPSRPVPAGGDRLVWAPYDFSWREGVEGDPGHQGYHGLKEEMPDDFIRLGKPRLESTTIVREKEAAGSRYYLWTAIAAARMSAGRLVAGGMKPAAVWVGGRLIVNFDSPFELEAGATPVLLRYDQPGTGWLLAVEPDFHMPEPIPGSLAMRWEGAQGVFPFDVRPDDPHPAGWYRFKAAPGLKAMIVTAIGEVEAWAEGAPLASAEAAGGARGARRLRFALPGIIRGEADIVLRIRHERGVYGGAALPEPVELECGEGELAAGDWSRYEGLESYSGGMLYKKEVSGLNPPDGGRVTLDLGGVSSSAEVIVNGKSCGIRVAPPWRWDIGERIRKGSNSITILVCNTLANHYLTIPTRYRGSPVSGLLGPVRLFVEK
ncbi:MAG: glycosyl hydrolase [Candidatus Aminicenantes bacterium]|nr:glycosyl hydrolase [Candidatus Aminicenantes bacterium]